MHQAPPRLADASPVRAPGRIERCGLWLRDHQRLVLALQWGMVALYLPLLILPAVLPPSGLAEALTRAAQALFWGIWLPGVLVSVLLFGRLWCGLLCPEGALTAAAARRGRGWAIPRWMKWPGWPFALFAGVTVVGQMAGIYDDPRAALAILGASSLSAVVVGGLYGRDKRVWCRFLCPVNGLFALLAKLAPLHYRVDARDWDACSPARARAMRFNCEPMVPVRTMESASPCHMCGRCAGFRDAVRLEARPAGEEVLRTPGSAAESLMALLGLVGIGSAAFWWPATLRLAGQEPAAPAVALAIVVLAVALAAAVAAPLALAARIAGGGHALFHRLALALLPLAAAGLLVGLTERTAALLEIEARPIWALLLLAGALWSLELARRLRTGRGLPLVAVALLPPLAGWGMILWP